MQNPKTGGNRFNPDIRPSEIDTYTETNGEQTAEYKIINAHPIIGGILNKLAFFRTHAAAVYYNRLANKTVKEKFDDVDAAVGELNEKIIPLEFNVPEGSDIDTEKYRKFGFYSGKGLVNAPTNAWFQWLTFPLNGNLKYPAQIGFWVDNHSGDVRMYTRALSDVSGTHVWKNWVEIATNEKFKIIESAEIAFNTSTTINYTLYSLPAPSGYKVVSREFIRLDDGAYNVLVSLLQNRDYIVHMGASERTVRGKVMALCIKTN